MNGTDPHQQRWGQVTVDVQADGVAIHVFNSNLDDDENRSRTLAFALNKARYYATQLPADLGQKFVFDVGGQSISDSDAQRFATALGEQCDAVGVSGVAIEFRR